MSELLADVRRSPHRPSTIAIDGPAGSGKSTVGLAVAECLGYLYFDTGVMYRAVTWLALHQGLPITDEVAVTALAEVADIDVTPPTVADGRQVTVLVNGFDVTWGIREPQVGAHVSIVAAYGGVRAALVIQQRRVALRGRVIMVGRDIGTVVMPDADLKIFLDASLEKRAERRWLEEQSRGGQRTVQQVQEELHTRDVIDSTRQHSPLTIALDAVYLDTTQYGIDQVVDQVMTLVQA